MNKYVKAFIASLAIATILFLLFAFITANINPFKWTIPARFLLSVIMFIFGLFTFRFTLVQIEYDREQIKIAKEFDRKRETSNAFIKKLDEMTDEVREQTKTLSLNRSIFMSENRLDLSKLNKEDFKNL